MEHQTRPHIMQAYLQDMVTYLHNVTRDDPAEIEQFVKGMMKSCVQDHRVIMLDKTKTGDFETRETTLLNFCNATSDLIVTPSGSAFYPDNMKQSPVSAMVTQQKAERKKVKKQQLRAEADGDEGGAGFFKNQQTSIKINLNSLPGGYASSRNIFYDKGCYNAITSSARCMITRAYTLAEQMLGGNFPFFDVTTVLNHIVIHLQSRPTDEAIQGAITQWHLKVPTVDELLDFYTKTVKLYKRTVDMTPVRELLFNLTPVEISYLYYFCNLRHLFWENETTFKPYLEGLFELPWDMEIPQDATVDDVYKFDETVLAVVGVAFVEDLNGYSIDIITREHKEMIPKLVGILKIMSGRLSTLQELVRLFVDTDVDVPDVTKLPSMFRTTVIISDTDSVIFTAEAWHRWFNDDAYSLSTRSYRITSLVIYWLHHAVRNALYVFSQKFNVSPERLRVLAMKNEFLYSISMLFDIKKTYASLEIVQEGVYLPKPKADIKGQQLRGSILCKDSLDYAEEFLVKRILEPATRGQLCARDLVEEAVAREHVIRDSILAGESKFLGITSLKFEYEYANPDTQSQVRAHRCWKQVFEDKYGEIRPPCKVTEFPIIQPSPLYFANLRKMDPDIYERFKAWHDGLQSLPAKLITNPALEHIPEELVPLINIREVVYTNMKPVYLALSRINISPGPEDQKMLFMDYVG